MSLARASHHPSAVIAAVIGSEKNTGSTPLYDVSGHAQSDLLHGPLDRLGDF
jgi:hypothetical protein